MTISLIAAMTKNYVIGKNNTIPWNIPEDLQWFKKNTIDKPIIMGYKTFISIGKIPLSRRLNIVLSRHIRQESNVCLVNSPKEALFLAKNSEEIMIIGGESVFKIFLPQAGKLYITNIDTTIDGDTYFPEYSKKEWKIIFKKSFYSNLKNNYSCTWNILTRFK